MVNEIDATTFYVYDLDYHDIANYLEHRVRQGSVRMEVFSILSIYLKDEKLYNVETHKKHR